MAKWYSSQVEAIKSDGNCINDCVNVPMGVQHGLDGENGQRDSFGDPWTNVKSVIILLNDP